MASLVVDIDVLRTTINTYNTQIANLRAAEQSIKSALMSLKASGWDSGAGKTWFSLLDDEWLKNIDYQLRVFGMLRDNIITAKYEYEGVYGKQQQLSKKL